MKMKKVNNFLTDQENIFFCFSVRGSFQFWQKNFCDTLAPATSLTRVPNGWVVTPTIAYRRQLVVMSSSDSSDIVRRLDAHYLLFGVQRFFPERRRTTRARVVGGADRWSHVLGGVVWADQSETGTPDRKAMQYGSHSPRTSYCLAQKTSSVLFAVALIRSFFWQLQEHGSRSTAKSRAAPVRTVRKKIADSDWLSLNLWSSLEIIWIVQIQFTLQVMVIPYKKKQGLTKAWPSGGLDTLMLHVYWPKPNTGTHSSTTLSPS